ncbi:MAG: orc1/cdc6 family replication initiation protein [DPANN group archaeon]|nr:orc1/cdc6 family replication initiation protein [DPANN group archaeon]
MVQQTLENLFTEYINSKNIFLKKDALSLNYTPENVSYREEQMKQLGSVLAPILKNNKPSNVFIYGITGTGKTLVTKHVIDQLKKIANLNNVEITTLYVNCKMKRVADTEYRLLAYILSLFDVHVPPTGLPTESIYKIFFDTLKNHKEIIILTLDEIDALVDKIGDEFLYNLTRMNQYNEGNIVIVGISNNLTFTEKLDSRVKSSLCDEELVFSPYNATQLKNILSDRAKVAFCEGILRDGVIAKCAALAAQEHGDARRALNLLRVSGEIAERDQDFYVDEKHVDFAQSKINLDYIMEAVKVQPKQSKVVLYSIIKLLEKEGKPYIYTGDVFSYYDNLCKSVGLKPLTTRRVSDLISELEMLSIIETKVISRGRHGRTRVLNMSVSDSVVVKIRTFLKEEFLI